MSILFALATLLIVFAVPTAIICGLVAKPEESVGARAGTMAADSDRGGPQS
jgi:hypothetical protein